MLTSAWPMAWLASRMIECSDRCDSWSSRISHSSTVPSALTGDSSVIDSPTNNKDLFVMEVALPRVRHGFQGRAHLPRR